MQLGTTGFSCIYTKLGIIISFPLSSHFLPRFAHLLPPLPTCLPLPTLPPHSLTLSPPSIPLSLSPSLLSTHLLFTSSFIPLLSHSRRQLRSLTLLWHVSSSLLRVVAIKTALFLWNIILGASNPLWACPLTGRAVESLVEHVPR